MTFLIDSDVAIHLRDMNDAVWQKVAILPDLPTMSVVTVVELEGGITGAADVRQWRRDRVDTMTADLVVHVFDTRCAAAYGRIVAASGFSRRKISDRMIAATALVHGLTLITMNGTDYRDVPGLATEVWDLRAA